MTKPSLTLHLPGGPPMTFQRIPPEGAPEPFRLGERGLTTPWGGASEPVVRVRLGGAFYLGTFPVTQAQFAVWTQAAGIEHKNDCSNQPEHPAENMDWRQAMAFCAWLTQVAAEEMPAGFKLACLPTEAEWEYACRAGSQTRFCGGDEETTLLDYGWFEKNSGFTSHPVGQKQPNAWGFYDMHGNVFEWCEDWYAQDYYQSAPRHNPICQNADRGHRVVRGDCRAFRP